MKKKSDFNSNRTTTAGFILKPMALLLMTIILCFSACKREKGQDSKPSASKKISAETSVEQPLPGGKPRFIWVNGNFDATTHTWQRVWQLTFTALTGKVDAVAWTWKSPNEVGKVPFNSHQCTMEGLTKTCTVYTPHGWTSPTGQSEAWSGTYVYNAATRRLDITWSAPSFAVGAKESWTITNPNTALARASLISSSYSLTHGRGYGSYSSFGTYKTIAQMVTAGLPNFSDATSKAVSAKAVNETSAPTITPLSATFNTWGKGVMNLSVFNTSATPPNTLHYRSFTTGSGVSCSCTTSRLGFVYHLASKDNGRGMVYNMWCACMPTNDEFPCYNRQMHPFAIYQVLDDNNKLVALIGGEIQNELNSAGYLFSLQDYNNIP